MLDALPVVCAHGQARLTAVVSEALPLAKYVERMQSPLPFATPTASRTTLLSFGPPVVGQVTPVAAIDAVANYFKHREEWSNWKPTAKSKNKTTITTITAVELAWTSASNLRTAARALG